MATAKVAAGNGRRAATSGSAAKYPIRDGRASASAGAFHVLLAGAAQPYLKWLPVYFASGGSMTASGLPIPGAVSIRASGSVSKPLLPALRGAGFGRSVLLPARCFARIHSRTPNRHANHFISILVDHAQH
jgi:hypothetical protein